MCVFVCVCVCLLTLMRLTTHAYAVLRCAVTFLGRPDMRLTYYIITRTTQRVQQSRHSKHSPDGGCVFDSAKYVRSGGRGSHLMDLSCMRVLCWCFVFVLLKRSYDDFPRLNSLRHTHTHEGPIWILYFIYALFPHSWPKRQVRVIKHNVFAHGLTKQIFPLQWTSL